MVRDGKRARRGWILLGALVAALALAPDGFAHAYAVATSPSGGAVVPRSPALVGVRYDEPVTTSAGALSVYDAAGNRVDSRRLSRPSGTEVAVAIDRTLPRGTYTATWRVTSADTHVVTGAWVFSVGARTAVSAAVAARLRAQGAVPASVSVPLTAVRFLSFALLLACAGGAGALLLVLGDISDRARRRLAGMLVVLASALALFAFAGIALQGASSGGFGLERALRPSGLSAVLGTRFGEVWRVRAWLALGLALVALWLERGPGGRALARRAALALGALALVPTTSAASHANIAGAATFAVDAAHVAAGGAWTGGLAFVVLALVFVSPAERAGVAARVLPRFSALAIGSVALLLASGVANTYLEVGSWRGLWETTYGRLVIAKVGLLLPLLALALLNLRLSRRSLRFLGASARKRRLFARAVAAEFALLATVIVVTAVLVDERRPKDYPRTARAAVASAHRTSSTVGPFLLRLAVSPARPGANAVDLRLSGRSGMPAPVAEVQLDAGLPAKDVGPLHFEARRIGEGHFSVARAQLPIAGTWRLTLTVRRGEFDEWLKTVRVQIGKET